MLIVLGFLQAHQCWLNAFNLQASASLVLLFIFPAAPGAIDCYEKYRSASVIDSGRPTSTTKSWSCR